MKAKPSYFLVPLTGTIWLSLAVATWAAGTQQVNAELWNKSDGSQGVTLSTDHVKPGKVVFNVKNISDNEDHELLLANVASPDALPMDESGARVDEDKLKGLKELGDVHPGKSRSTTLRLKPGKYMLFCNEAGHFKAGMYATFTVAP
ncbi:plastocyanin/azurin family copper-binding protein [Mesorhizobium sp. BAC0120]|uniref:plastocyanin/azurin family copper-binding protein n=1 Tax=Mesorhizobium sp. BAC0120 TaxID=3090670 RepID=UPI00298CD1C5|nr:plastocyanin/azurin family copper-binding protein [Mesorhizobium sp. BAC0120]MDW6025716.1 plastocyanin/azurin family copper-binding protein [Mesorhizobium sp. BAC0120]